VPAAPTYAVVDGNSLMHRAFHAIPPTFRAPDGRPTNAVFGFVSMLVKLLEDFAPQGLAVAFDKGLPAVRLAELPSYKAQRPPRDPLLSEQFPMVRELLEAMSVPVFAVEGWEGDDLLGTLARQGSELGCQMLLVTGDRDAYQLASDRVRIVATKKGISDVVVYGPAEVEELYEGVRPEQIPDFYGLKGDTSDNIPGVPGIGPKKASALIVEYGSLDEVIAHADQIKGKMGQNIREHVDDALVSRRVATIRLDAPVTFDPAAAAWPSFDPAAVEHAFTVLGLASLKPRVLALGAAAGAAAPAAEKTVGASLFPNLPAEPLRGPEARRALEDALGQPGAWVGVYVDEPVCEGSLFALDGDGPTCWLALDGGWEPEVEVPACPQPLSVVDVGSQARIAGVPLCAQSAAGLPVPAGRPAAEPARVLRFDGDEALWALEQAYTRGHVASFDAKADLRRLAPTDSSEPARCDLSQVAPDACFDVAVASYVLNSDAADFTPDALVARFAPWELPALEYAAGDGPDAAKPAKSSKPAVPPAPDEASRTRRGVAAAASARVLLDQLSVLLAADGSAGCVGGVEMPLVPVLVQLERNGMAVDVARLRGLSGELGAQVDAISSRIFEQAGERFNIDSPSQLSHVLFDVLNLPTTDPDTGRPLKRTKRGFYSTNAKMLDALAGEYAVVADVLDYRERVKIKNTYLDALPHEIQGDGRVHTTYNQTVTATGRLSSSNPNLQNIPVRSELGRMVRTAFVPSGPDNVILSCDYSQIELRLLAHLSGDAGLVEAFTHGEDFHAETAARVFGVPAAQVTPEQRSRAKAVNFGIVYGQTAWGLSQTLHISAAEAQEMIDRYYITYPGVRRYLDEQVAFAREHQWVSTMFGRKRHVPDIASRNPNLRQFAERTAMNHPMQGSAADIIKLAMARVQEALVREGLAARMVVQVHDELDFDCPRGEVAALCELVPQIMGSVAELRVPLVVSCSTGATWAEAK
jgi:DNA polymerase-1